MQYKNKNQIQVPSVAPERESDTSLSADIKQIQGSRATIDKTIWMQIDKFPENLKKASRVASALPSTQVTVERLFSQLRLVLRDNRANMGARLADALLFLRSNKCV